MHAKEKEKERRRKKESEKTDKNASLMLVNCRLSTFAIHVVDEKRKDFYKSKEKGYGKEERKKKKKERKCSREDSSVNHLYHMIHRS